MSMIGNYRRLALNELSHLLANSESISDFLYSETQESAATDRELDIDKAWHAIHFLLCGSSWEGSYPLACVVMGGETIGTADVGYGPARYLMPQQVTDVANALDNISVSELLDRFDAAAMNDEEIYPHGWRDSSEEREYIGCNYMALVKFFRNAADANDAMILFLN